MQNIFGPIFLSFIFNEAVNNLAVNNQAVNTHPTDHMTYLTSLVYQDINI